MANLAKNLTGFTKVNNTLLKAIKTDVADKIEIEIGDSKQPDFKPQFKISRWDNEVNFSIRAEEDPTATVTVAGGIVKYKAKDYEVHQYEKPEVSEDGGYEFEWVIPKKPKSNVLTATIQTKELDFFYQPALTEEEIAEGANRPDNVVGSYAVYHKTGRNNIVGGKEYKTGKAFHIYRPEAVDALGNKTWCELNIDEAKGELTVTVPQTYLDTASYPVVVDPTFGYTTIGVSNVLWGAYFIASNRTQMSENGTMSKIQMAAWDAEANSTIKMAVYTDTTGPVPNALVANSYSGAVTVTRTTKPTNDSHWTSNSGVTGSLVSGSYYWLALNPNDTTVNMAYDTGAPAGSMKWVAQTYADFPTDPAPTGTSNSSIYSIYVTYTASGGDASTPTRMMMGIGS